MAEWITAASTMFVGVVKHTTLHLDDGGGWIVGHVDWHAALEPFDGKRVRVTIETTEHNDDCEGYAHPGRTCDEVGFDSAQAE